LAWKAALSPTDWWSRSGSGGLSGASLARARTNSPGRMQRSATDGRCHPGTGAGILLRPSPHGPVPWRSARPTWRAERVSPPDPARSAPCVCDDGRESKWDALSSARASCGGRRACATGRQVASRRGTSAQFLTAGHSRRLSFRGFRWGLVGAQGTTTITRRSRARRRQRDVDGGSGTTACVAGRSNRSTTDGEVACLSDSDNRRYTSLHPSGSYTMYLDTHDVGGNARTASGGVSTAC
jgi:hypothetical protein